MAVGRVLIDSIHYSLAAASFVTGSSRSFSGPVAAFIEPTNICNLNCPLCACGSGALRRPSGCMSFSSFRRIVDALPESVGTLYLWGQGEPFIAPGFTDMIRHASDRGLRTITSTNGHFLDDPDGIIDSGLDTVIVSLDGIDAESYDIYRSGGDFSRVCDGIRRLAARVDERGDGPEIEIQYLLTIDNVKNTGEFDRLARSLGADHVTYKTVQAVSMQDGESWLPDDLALTRYRRGADGKLVPDRRRLLENRCYRIYHVFQIDWQGNVLPCCFDKDSDHVLGNLLENTIDSIWNGDVFRSFRDAVNCHGRVIPMCRDCTEGLKRVNIRM